MSVAATDFRMSRRFGIVGSSGMAQEEKTQVEAWGFVFIERLTPVPASCKSWRSTRNVFRKLPELLEMPRKIPSERHERAAERSIVVQDVESLLKHDRQRLRLKVTRMTL